MSARLIKGLVYIARGHTLSCACVGCAQLYAAIANAIGEEGEEMAPDPPRRSLVSEYHAAQLLDVSERILKRLIRQGEIDAFEIAKGHVRIESEEIERFIAARKVTR